MLGVIREGVLPVLWCFCRGVAAHHIDPVHRDGPCGLYVLFGRFEDQAVWIRRSSVHGI